MNANCGGKGEKKARNFGTPTLRSPTLLLLPSPVRSFCIATGPYSSFCGCTRDLVLGSSDHVEDDEQNRESEEIGQDVETHTKERKRSMGGETTNDQTRDDMWMSGLFLQRQVLQHLEPCKGICANVCARKYACVFCSHLPSVTVDRYQP